MPSRRIALACLTPLPDTDELGSARLPSFGIRRIQAAVAADPECPGHVVQLFDFVRADIASYVERILDFAPDILGFSIYVWSTECMVAVAREIKRRRPTCVIVFGGPSARSALFDLDHYRDPNSYMDALVEGDGEVVFRQIARAPQLNRAMLLGVRGLTVPTRSGWHRTPPTIGAAELDLLPSPFQLDLIPEGSLSGRPEPGYIFRGHFLDLRTLAFALTDRGYSLEQACKAFGVEHGKQKIDRHGILGADEELFHAVIAIRGDRRVVQSPHAVVVVARIGKDDGPAIGIEDPKVYNVSDVSNNYLIVTAIRHFPIRCASSTSPT